MKNPLEIRLKRAILQLFIYQQLVNWQLTVTQKKDIKLPKQKYSWRTAG